MHYALGKKYPIETKEQVKTASDYFTKYLTRLDPADRVIVASRLEKRAGELGLNLDEIDWVVNYSRMTKEGACISPTFEWNLGIRKEAMHRSGQLIKTAGKQVNAEEALGKIAELKEAGAHGHILVQVLEEFDKAAGLQYEYDTKYPDPVMTVYGNYANPKFDAIKLAEDITDYDVISASRDDDIMSKVASTFGSAAAAQFRHVPLTTFLATKGPELDVLSNIIRR